MDYRTIHKIKKRKLIMKRMIILYALTVCCYTAIYALPGHNRNSFMMDIDGLFGQLDSSDKTAGILVHGGYDIFFRGITFLSIEPKIGVGYFGRSRTEEPNSTPISSYNITCFTASVSPKLHLSLNPDDTAFLFLENEFSLLNAHARIEDQGRSKTRVSSTYQFYYTLKLGLSFKISSNNKLGIWVGGSTLRFDTLLNRHIPKEQKRYSGETTPFTVGVDFYL